MYCLDTYALMDLYNGVPAIGRLLIEEEIIIPSTTLAELYSVMLRRYNKKTADYWHEKLHSLVREVHSKTLVNAMIHKYEHRKKKISFFDSVGYIYAHENNLIFVTGDKAFMQEKGVLFLQ